MQLEDKNSVMYFYSFERIKKKTPAFTPFANLLKSPNPNPAAFSGKRDGDSQSPQETEGWGY